jgi:hypothetical protein
MSPMNEMHDRMSDMSDRGDDELDEQFDDELGDELDEDDSDEDDDGDDGDEGNDGTAPTTPSQPAQPPIDRPWIRPRKPRLPRVDKLSEDQLERLAIGRIERKTWAQLAQEMGVSERTIRRWSSTSAFRERFNELRREWVDLARAKIQRWGDDVVGGMYQLAMTARSEMVRYQALAKLGDWMGVGEPVDERDTTTRDELLRLYAVIEQTTARRTLEDEREHLRQLLQEIRQYQPGMATLRQLPVERVEDLSLQPAAPAQPVQSLQEAPPGATPIAPAIDAEYVAHEEPGTPPAP